MVTEDVQSIFSRFLSRSIILSLLRSGHSHSKQKNVRINTHYTRTQKRPSIGRANIHRLCRPGCTFPPLTPWGETHPPVVDSPFEMQFSSLTRASKLTTMLSPVLEISLPPTAPLAKQKGSFFPKDYSILHHSFVLVFVIMLLQSRCLLRLQLRLPCRAARSSPAPSADPLPFACFPSFSG